MRFLKIQIGTGKKATASNVMRTGLINGLASLVWPIQLPSGIIQYIYMLYYWDHFRFIYIGMQKRSIHSNWQSGKMLLMWLFLSSLSLDAQAAFRVVLDPGHGGHDNGAVFEGVREADLVLAVGSKLSRYLAAQAGWTVVVTRDGDHFVSLHDRVRRAQESASDLFVSIHANSAGKNQKVHGAEFFFHEVDRSTFVSGVSETNDVSGASGAGGFQKALSDSQNKGATRQALSIEAQNIVDSLRQQGLARQSMLVTKQIWSVWRESADSPLARLKQEPFFVLAKNAIPSVLIEVGFMSHPQEIKKLMNSDYQDRIVRKIASALVRYKESLDKSQAK